MQLKFQQVKDVQLAYFESGYPGSGRPTLLFVHATGFHARVWDQIIARFPQQHIIALEQRGHGRSDKVAATHWRTFGIDQAEFVTALGLDSIIGIGHSMGAHAMIDAAAQSGAFSRLLLLDPTVSSPMNYAQPGDGLDTNLSAGELHPASKRRNHFASVDEMVEQISTKSAFPLFEPQILRDYCEFGLEPLPNGGLQLCCKPEVEAQVYMSARSNGAIYGSIDQLQIPVTVVRAKLPENENMHDFSSSPTWPELANEFANAQDLHLSDCTHFIPMQRPDFVVELIQNEIAAWKA